MKLSCIFIFFTFYAFTQLNLNDYAKLVDNEFFNSEKIDAIEQDSKNRMWIGTHLGLYCFDGYETFLISTTSKIAKISSNSVITMYFDKSTANLWVGTNHGLNVLNTKTLKSVEVNLSSLKEPDSKSACILKIIQRSNGTFLVSCLDGSIFSVSKTFQATQIAKSSEKLNDGKAVHEIIEYKGAIYFANRAQAVYRIDNELKNTQLIRRFTEDILQLYISNRGVVVRADLNEYELTNLGKTREIKKLNNLKYEIRSSFSGKNGISWISKHGQDLFEMDDLSRSVKSYFLLSKLSSIKAKFIHCVFTDNQGNNWLGTDNGIVKISRPDGAISKVFDTDFESKHFNLSMREMLEDKNGDIYFAGYGMFAKQEKQTNTLVDIIMPNILEMKPFHNLTLEDDTIWVGTEGRGLYTYSIKTNKLSSFDKLNKLIASPKFIISFYKNQNTLWLGSYETLYNFYLNTNKLLSERHLNRLKSDEGLDIIQFLELKNGNLLLASDENGIYIVDKNKKFLQKITINELLKLKTYNQVLNVVFEDKNGILWIGTRDFGVIKYNLKTKEIKKINTENGLPNNNIASILQSNDGVLWFATNNGLCSYDESKNRFKIFYENDGLASNEFNRSSFLKTRNGMLFFGGINGVTKINPEKIAYSQTEYPFYFTKIIVPNEKENKEDARIISGNSLKTVNLSYQTRFFQAHFYVGNFKNNAKNTFFYQLAGLDKKWTNNGNLNAIRFNVLPPGDFILKIKVLTSDGNFLKKIISLKIHVDQVFYKSWWFVLITIISLISLIASVMYLLFKQRLNYYSNMANLRLKLASDLHDEVGGMLNKTAMQADLAKTMASTDSQKLLDKIALNCRNAMSGMRDIMWNLDSRNDNASDILDRMREYAQSMLEDRFSYTFEIENFQDIPVKPEIRQAIYLIYKEAINNIVKHAKSGKVIVRLHQKNDLLTMRVYNESHFISKEVSSGQGMRNMKMRAENLGGSFRLNTQNGVEIEVIIPQNSHESITK